MSNNEIILTTALVLSGLFAVFMTWRWWHKRKRDKKGDWPEKPKGVQY